MENRRLSLCFAFAGAVFILLAVGMQTAQS